MKKPVKKIVLNYAAKATLNAAQKAAGAASWWGCYQPKEPKAMKKSK